MKFATKPLQYKSFVGRVVVTPQVTPKMCFLRDISFFRREKKNGCQNSCINKNATENVMEVIFTEDVANLFYFSAKKKVNQNIEEFLSN